MPYQSVFDEGLGTPQPEENPGQSTLGKIADVALTPLNTAATVLGAPGSALRGVLAGKGLDSFTSWTSGRDLLDSWGVFPKGDGFDFTGLAADFIDPFLFVGSITGLTKAGKLADLASGTQKELALLKDFQVANKSTVFAPEIASQISSLEATAAKRTTGALAETVSQQFAKGQRGLELSIPFTNLSTGAIVNTEPIYNAIKPIVDKAKEFLPSGFNKYFSTAKQTAIGQGTKDLLDRLQAKGLEDSVERLRLYDNIFTTAQKELPGLTETKIKSKAVRLQELDADSIRAYHDTKISTLQNQVADEQEILTKRIQSKIEGEGYSDFNQAMTNPRVQRDIYKMRVSAGKSISKHLDNAAELIRTRNSQLKELTDIQDLGSPALLQLGKFYDEGMKTALTSEQALGNAILENSDYLNYAQHVLTPEAKDLVRNEKGNKYFRDSLSALINPSKERKISGALEEANTAAKKLFSQLKGDFYQMDPILFNENRLYLSQASQLQALSIQHAAMFHYDTFPTLENWVVGAKIEVPPAAAETIRFYHGGGEVNGPRWLSQDIKYAQGYASKSGGKVFYTDIPNSSPLLQKAFDDTGATVKAPFINFEAPADIAKNLKPLESTYKFSLGSPEGRAVAEQAYGAAKQQFLSTGYRPLSEVFANGRLTGTTFDSPVAPTRLIKKGDGWIARAGIPEEYKMPWIQGKISSENVVSTMLKNKDPALLLKSGDQLVSDLEASRNGALSWGIEHAKPEAAGRIQKMMDAAGVGDRYLREDLYQDLVKQNQSFTNNQKAFWRYWDTVNQLQRTYLTSLNPGYLSTNVLGNTWVNFIAGVKPSSYIDAFKLLVNKHIETNPEGWLSKLVSPFEISGDISSLGKEFYDTGAGGKNFLRAALEQEKGTVANNIEDKIPVVGPLLTKARDVGYGINSFNEDWAKMAHYISKRGEGLDLVQAGQSVKKYLFDYSDLAPFEKDIMRRFTLFYTFTRKMLPLGISETFLNQRAYALIHGSLGTQDSESFVPNYIKDTGQVYLGGNQFLDIRNPLFDTNRFSPEGQDLARTGQKLLAGTPAQIRLPLEAISDKQFFSGKSLENVTPLPGLGGQYINKNGQTTERLMHPALQELLSGTPAPQLFRSAAEPGKSFGFRINDVQPVEERKRKALIDTIKSQLSEYPEVRTFNDLYSAAQVTNPRVKELLKQLQTATKRTSL